MSSSSNASETILTTAATGFLKAGGPFTGPVPTPKDSSAVTILITGAARGIGLELTRQYAAANSESVVFAAVRDVKATTIVSLAAEYRNIIVVPMEITNDESIKDSLSYVTKVVDHLDILINNAGISGMKELPASSHREDFLHVLSTNVGGPMVVTQTYLPLLRKATKQPSRVINISSGMGSNAWAAIMVKAFGSEVSTSYAVSKAALNYLTTLFSASVADVIFVAVSPGWVETDMASPGAPVKAKDCAQALRALIESRHLKHSGLFFDNIDNGAQIPY